MRIYTGDAMSHTIKTETAMRGLIISIRTNWEENGTSKSYDVSKAKLSASLQTSGEQITIVPKRGLQEISDVTTFKDSSSFRVQDEAGETWHMFAIEWNGDGDSAIHMRPNSEYQIELSCGQKVKVEVNAIKDESVSTLLRTHSVLSVDRSEQKEQKMEVENGLIVAVTVPIFFDPSSMDYKLIVSHENGEDIEYGYRDLVFMALSHDETKTVEVENDGVVGQRYANERLTIPLINASSPVRKIRIINDTSIRFEFMLTILRSI